MDAQIIVVVQHSVRVNQMMGIRIQPLIDAFEEGVSLYGAFQMAGNVNEWTADWYDKNFYSSLSDGDENPDGPASGQLRVVRGGSFGLNAFKLRASNRGSIAPSKASEYDGFRCATDLP